MQSSEEEEKAKKREEAQKRAADKKKDDLGHAQDYKRYKKDMSERRVREMKQVGGWKNQDFYESADELARDRQEGRYAPPDPDEANPDPLKNDALLNAYLKDQAPSPPEEDGPGT